MVESSSLTTRWILTLGIATLCFGIFLFVLRIPIRTIGIFFVLGIPLILLWLYAGDKSKQQRQQKEKITSDPSSSDIIIILFNTNNRYVYVLFVSMNKQESV